MLPLPDLPVRAALGDVRAALTAAGATVLVAPPGTGKTTLVPLDLADALPGRIVVAEPRRIAARAAASRMAQLHGSALGGHVGYAVRGDRALTDATRVQVVTTGVLLRRLQRDPELPGVSAVVIDECHERHLDADLALALLLDARSGLRPDLHLLATSATPDTVRLAALLGDAPVVSVRGTAHPVRVHHVAPLRGEGAVCCAARAVRRALAEAEGDVLVFLPGAGEIRRCAAALSGVDAVVLPLHGRLTAAAQDDALRPAPGRRRVVLATAVAEASLTVPGVRAVVDTGLARVPRVDHRRGLSGLATVRVSRAAAGQRAGRAGREAPGAVYRCWPEHEHATLPAAASPEILTAELTALALELACWGTPDGAALRWLDPPPAGPLAAGREVLRALGALDRAGAVTSRGRSMARLGVHPRLARALLDAPGAAEVVAVLGDDQLAPEIDLAAALRRLQRERPGRWAAEVRRLGGSSGADPAEVVALAHPERLARRRAPGSAAYLLAGGTEVRLPAGSGLEHCEWLAVAVADRAAGVPHATVRLAVAADEDLARRAGAALLVRSEQVRWERGDVRAEEVQRLGAIVLRSSVLRDPDPALVHDALVDGLRSEGPDVLRWTDGARRLRSRLAFLHGALGSPWPDVTDGALLTDPDAWIGPELALGRRRADLAAIDVAGALRRLLGWQERASLDALAPERLPIPTGSQVRLDYAGEQPVLALRVQEAFGWTASPTVAGVPVLVHLLSPAGRPVAVTADLASFWETGYPQVRAELRGQYPKHPWPADPLTAAPTRRAGRHRPA